MIKLSTFINCLFIHNNNNNNNNYNYNIMTVLSFVKLNKSVINFNDQENMIQD